MKNSTEDSPSKFSEAREYAALQPITHEGEVGGGWYILLQGKVGVFKHNRKVAELDKRGAVFGELSSILNTTRTASITALEPTKVIFVDATLDELIANFPDVTKRIMINLAERLAKTTDELVAIVEKENENPPKEWDS